MNANSADQNREKARRTNGTFGHQHRDEPADMGLTTDKWASSAPRTRPDGVVEWLTPDGELHRKDGPAVIYPDGTEVWYSEGLLGRTDGPTITRPDGSEEWYLPVARWGMSVPHRDGGPAKTHADGTEDWWYVGTRSTREAELERTRKLNAPASTKRRSFFRRVRDRLTGK